MEIASKYEIAAANLAIALQTDTVSVEQRSELRAAIGSSIDKLVDALNMIIVCYNKRMYAGEIAPEKAAKCVKAEYAAIGLSNVVAYDYFSAAVGAFFTRKTLMALSTDEKLAWVKTIFEQNAAAVSASKTLCSSTACGCCLTWASSRRISLSRTLSCVRSTPSRKTERTPRSCRRRSSQNCKG